MRNCSARRLRRTSLSAAAVLALGAGATSAYIELRPNIATASPAPVIHVETVATPTGTKTAVQHLTPGPAQIQGANSAQPEAPSPGQMLPAGAPTPLSPELISPTNGWIVATTSELVAVYAGSAGEDPTTGRFAIVRQQQPAGTQTVTAVDIAGVGALTITGAPTGSTDSDANGDITYRAANGSTGVLDLANDTTSGG